MVAFWGRMYSPEEAMALVLCPCDIVRGENVPKRVEVQIRYEAAKVRSSLTGGYDPDDLCPNCFCALSVTGMCALCNVT